MKRIQLELDEVHIKALESLTPGLGNDVDGVVRFIIIDWLNKTFGVKWMESVGRKSYNPISPSKEKRVGK